MLQARDAQAQVRRESLVDGKAADLEAYTLDWLRIEHQKVIDECRSKGDFANVTANLIAIGKTIGAYADVHVLDPGRVKQFSQFEQLEARKLAGLLVASNMEADNYGDDNHPVGSADNPALDAGNGVDVAAGTLVSGQGNQGDDVLTGDEPFAAAIDNEVNQQQGVVA